MARLIKVVLALTLSFASLQEAFSATDKVICYYSSWAVYRPDNGKFQPEDVDANVCTHVYYAFLGVQANGSLSILDSWGDIDLGGYEKINDLKQINPNLKTIISIGGWNAGNAILTGIAATPELRANLAASSIEYFEKWGFDGLDIDWEYPLASDRDNFVALLRDLKNAFQAGGYLVTLAVSAIPIDDAYDIPAMSEAVDLINLMTYDFHVWSVGVTGHNSPLYAGSSDNDWQKQFENCQSAVANWVQRGADPQKLTLGIPFYGHTFQLTDPGNHGVGSPANGPGEAGPYTKNNGTLGYNEICELHGDWERVWDDEQKVPYRFSGNQWVAYDDEESIALKVQFAKEQNLAGLMIWSVDTDDFKGLCGRDHGLLQALKDNL